MGNEDYSGKSIPSKKSACVLEIQYDGATWYERSLDLPGIHSMPEDYLPTIIIFEHEIDYSKDCTIC
jgi:hypothetical protein